MIGIEQLRSDCKGDQSIGSQSELFIVQGVGRQSKIFVNMLILRLLAFLVDPIHGLEALLYSCCPVLVGDVQLSKLHAFETEMFFLAEFVILD